MHSPIHQFGRYVAVGVLNTAVTLVAYHALLVAGAHFRLASAAGYTLGGLTSYAANRAWTFAGHHGPHRRAGPRFFVVFVLGLVTDLVLISLLVYDLGVAKLAAQLFVAPVVAVQGFVLARQWAFRGPTVGPSAAVGNAGKA
jgi:putative flippase GtrA